MRFGKTYSRKLTATPHRLVFMLVVAAAAAAALGDAQQAMIVARADDAAQQPQPSAGAAVQTITFNADTTIQEALSVLAQKYQKNIVPSPSVTGVLSFTRLYNVTFEEAMEAILGPNLKYEQVGQLIKVYTKEEYKKIKSDTDRMIHRVFTLYYITAEDAAKLIKPVLSSAAVIEFSTPAERDIGGGSSSGTTGGSSPGGISSGGGGDSLAQNDTIVVYDFPENIDKAAEIIAKLDKRPKQVLVEATILSARLTEGMELGIDLNFLGGVDLQTTETTSQVGSTDTTVTSTSQNPLEQVAAGTFAGSPVQVTGFATFGGVGLRAGISADNFIAFITALESVTDVTVLANPKILAVNKQEGTVLIGRNLGYRSSTTISTGGVATEGEVKFLQTGTQLVFRPYIGDDGYIRMDIYPKDSTAELNEQGVPDESTTELRTNIVVKDGETIVLGGLFRDVVSSTRQQIPLLGDIPIIGALFRGTTDQTQREEVIILLTPHIIEQAGQTDGEARAADISRKRYGARQNVLGIARSRIAEDHYVKAVELYTAGKLVEAQAEIKETLRLRPSYLEALRLQERIIRETVPEELDRMERIMLGVIEQEEAALWNRR